MTETEFQKGDDVIRVANKEEYPSNSILDIRAERCWFIFMIHFPSAAFHRAWKSFKIWQSHWRKQISRWFLEIVFSFPMANERAWGQISHVDDNPAVEILCADCPYAYTSPIIKATGLSCLSVTERYKHTNTSIHITLSLMTDLLTFKNLQAREKKKRKSFTLTQ